MKKSTAISLVISAVLIVLGAACIITALAITDCNMEMLSDANYEMITEDITGGFKSINITESGARVRVVPSDDGIASVEYVDIQDRNYIIKVEDDILDIRVNDERPWYSRISMDFNAPMTLTVMLPEQDYEKLYVNNGSGGIEVSESFKFTAAEIESGSGGVSFDADVDGDVAIDSSSGGINVGSVQVNNLTCECSSGGMDLRGVIANSIEIDSGSGKVEVAECDASLIKIKVSSGGTQVVSCRADSLIISSGSGKMNVYDSECGDMELENSSGGLYIENTIATGRITIDSGSGGVEFDRIDAEELMIDVSSGGVRGTLLSGKMFSVSAGSGSVNVPDDDPNGGYCKINSGSGSIKITIAK